MGDTARRMRWALVATLSSVQYVMERTIYNGPQMARPREFDEEDVIAAAGEIFWARGFEGSSTRDLSAATGLTPSSLYSAFGSKRGLFVKALDRYLEQTLRERMTRIEARLSGLTAIKAFFDEVVERSAADRQHRGCMMVNAIVDAASHDTELMRYVAQETEQIEAFFRRCIADGQAAAEISPALATQGLARHLLSVLMGLRVLARVRPDTELLTEIVGSTLSVLRMPERRRAS
jgi:TetR/AcrR family transcriptional repressor of nem operon